MAEATIGHLIEVMKSENEQTRSETKSNTSQLITLNRTVSNYFKMMQQQSLDNLEEERESKRSAKSPTVSSGSMMGDLNDKGFLGIIGGVLGAISGFLFGAVEGIIRAWKLTARGVNTLLKGYPVRILKGITNITKNIFRPIIGFFDAIGDAFRKAGTNKLVRNRQFLGRGLAPITNFFADLKSFFKAAIPFRGITTEIKKLPPLTKSFLKSMALIPEMGKFFKDITKLKEIILPIKKASEATGDGIGIIGRFMNTIGGTFKSIMNAIKPMFGVFRTLGRVIFFPLTIIMGVVDAIKGAVEGFKQEGFLGGILGIIGGLARGLIGMPLDLLKSGISWIAGKLGFENFSNMLDSFSFGDMIFNMFMKVANIGNEIISNLFGGFEDGFGAGMKQMLKTLLIYTKRMMMFPVALAAGAAAALGAILPGGKSPLEAFTDTFGKVIKVGEVSSATTLPSEQTSIDGEEGIVPQPTRERREVSQLEFNKIRLASLERMSQKGDLSSRQADELERRRKAVERMERSGQNVSQVNAVNAPTTVNNNANTAVYSDPSPATDDLDRASMAW